jgi:hypothetical protein
MRFVLAANSIAAICKKKSGDTFHDRRGKLFNTAEYRIPQIGNYRIYLN